jgi:hypothetical protein
MNLEESSGSTSELHFARVGLEYSKLACSRVTVDPETAKKEDSLRSLCRIFTQNFGWLASPDVETTNKLYIIYEVRLECDFKSFGERPIVRMDDYKLLTLRA